MSHALVTIVAPLALGRLAEAGKRIDALGNPARPDIAAALDRLNGDDGTHFASFHAVASGDGVSAYLVLEFSADGDEDTALARLSGAIGNDLRTVFELAADWRHGVVIAAYLRAHRAPSGNGLFGNPGVGFAGTPGMSVGRIRREGLLAAKCVALLGQQPGNIGALERLEATREALKSDPAFAAELGPAMPAPPPFVPQNLATLIAGLAIAFIQLYLWPFAILVLAWAFYAGAMAARTGKGALPLLLTFLKAALPAFGIALLLALAVFLVIAGIAYLALRKAEQTDSLEEHAPDRATLKAILERENRCAQNHMISITRRKPGLLRSFTSRLVFWIVGEFAVRLYKPGFLSDIGTIHFARWVTIPGNRDVLFLSNYGGSWESYLEDFITRAHAGLTAVWSNTIGFPRTQNLFQKGATDGERFKRYARHSMIATRFWYSAYPGLSTANIRTNADIRRGLSGAMTEDEAASWLSLFGSASRPESKLVSNEIQSIIFGGLGFLPSGACVLCRLPADQAAARRWLALVSPYIAFNDGRRLQEPAVFTLALSASGMDKLGLPQEGLETFPAAFLDGMAARARVLGDSGASAPDNWKWGQAPLDAAVLIFGLTASDVAALEAQLTRISASCGVVLGHRVPLKEITVDKTEPFGFADGISQPVIRGTYKGRRSANPIHLVEPGEFILGYPDNRGNHPPGPTLPALADPDNHLPLLERNAEFSTTLVESPRDLGANGSFLVIRELEQDVAAFKAYCSEEATRLQNRLSVPYHVDANFIGAKLVGRWKDGSSLVRHPYHSQTREFEVAMAMHARSLSAVASMKAPGPSPGVAAPPSSGPPPASHPPARPNYRQDNDFLFGAEDPEALRCPFGAHIRRANPRESFDPGSTEQIAITNRHRIMRIGRQYEPQPAQNPGLFFMCLNGDIERQFEFVQQTWLGGPSFHGLSCETDPLVGNSNAACAFTVPSRDGPMRLAALPDFVTTRGGGYFFLPGKRLIAYLARPL